MRIVYYNSKKERITELKKANEKGESAIHDDFLDVNGKVTDGNSGKLTFDILDNTPDPKFLRMKELRKKLQDDSITFKELKEYLRSER